MNNNVKNFDDYDPAEILYMDRFGKIVDVLMDENGDIYVPLKSVTGIRKVVRKNPTLAADYYSNPDNYEIVDDNGAQDRSTPVQNERFKESREDKSSFRNSPRQDKPQRPYEKKNFKQNMFNEQTNHERPPRDGKPFFKSGNNDGRRSQGENFFPKNTSNNKPFNRRERSFPKNDHQSLDGDEDWSGTENASNSGKKENRITNKPLQKEPLKSIIKPTTSPLVKQTTSTISKPTTSTISKPTTEPSKPVHKFKYVTLPVGKTCEVMVTDIEKNIAWVQLPENTDTLIKLTQKVEEMAKKCTPVSNPTTGLSCLGIFEDLWFRATILNAKPLTLRYVDYGNVEENPTGEIREILKELSDIPAQAVQIKFIGNAQGVELNSTIKIHVMDYVNDVYHVKIPGSENEVAKAEEKISKNDKKETALVNEKKTVSACTPERMIFAKLTTGDAGNIVISKVLSPGRFVAGIMPSSFADELGLLQRMSIQIQPNATSK